MSGAARSEIYYENSQPILRVENMEAALRFYVDVLGFRNALLGATTPWRVIVPSLAMSVVLFTAGLLSFRRMERRGT